MLIVFDFHGTLSLKSGPDIKILKNSLRKTRTWYQSMKKSKIDPYIMMPTLDDIIFFTQYMKNYKRTCEPQNKDTIFAIASMLEDIDFMYDMITYCFESKNLPNPFFKKHIVSSHTLDEKVFKHNKMPHLRAIINEVGYIPETVLIDDKENVVNTMKKQGIYCVLVKNYFTLEDWNSHLEN